MRVEGGGGWLFTAPVIFMVYSALYLVQKHFLVKWFCRNCLSKSVELECDTVNASTVKEKQGDINRSIQNRKLVTDEDVRKIATE